MNKPKIENLTCRIMFDSDADLSYLDGSNHLPHNPENWDHVSDDDVLTAYNKAFKAKNSEFNHAKLIEKLDELYAAQDIERLQSYNNDVWCMFGVSVECEVSYDIGQGNRRLQHFSSGGLWGIESDSGKEYFASVRDEQIAELKTHLEIFGVDTSNIDYLKESIKYSGEGAYILN